MQHSLQFFKSSLHISSWKQSRHYKRAISICQIMKTNLKIRIPLSFQITKTTLMQVVKRLKVCRSSKGGHPLRIPSKIFYKRCVERKSWSFNMLTQFLILMMGRSTKPQISYWDEGSITASSSKIVKSVVMMNSTKVASFWLKRNNVFLMMLVSPLS